MKRQDKMSDVLIVDDDHNFRETLRELLSDAGYQTLAATNAEEAITLLQTTTPDLTLCDWKMPGGGVADIEAGAIGQDPPHEKLLRCAGRKMCATWPHCKADDRRTRYCNHG
jgi:CheY-like chemotaxis protein